MELDNDQRLVSENLTGNALVLAGAGSGKTACCVQRTVNLIRNGVTPARILLLTFTNKAAREMQSRIMDAIGLDAGRPTATTFHSFGYRLITKNPDVFDRGRWPSILTQKQSETILLESLVEANIAVDKREVRSAYMRTIELIAAAGIDFPISHEDDLLRFNEIGNQFDGAPLTRTEKDNLSRALVLYEERKAEQNVLDFSDLINLPRQALEQNPEFRKKISTFLLDVTVDEAQDNNLAQYKFMKALRSDTNTFTLVGDDDQSIYGFRGAAPESMSLYKSEFAPKVFHLARNYRSIHRIVDKASTMVARNETRIDKSPYAVDQSDTDNAIGWVRHKKEQVLAKNIVRYIKEEIAKGNRTYDDIAVLYRANAMVPLLEPELIAASIPYVVRKSTSLFDRTEVSLFTAFIRLTLNRKDRNAFAEVMSTIPGLGAKRMAAIVASNNPFKSGLVNEKIQDQIDKVTKEMDLLFSRTPRDALRIMMRAIDIEAFLTRKATTAVKAANDSDINDKDRAEQTDKKIKGYVSNMTLIQSAIDIRITDEDIPLDNDEMWFEAMSIITEPPERSQEDDPYGRVTLSTGHGAKGLEWPIVHCAGMSEGLMPMGEDPNIEEERRLAYVMVTRAERQVIFHHIDSLYLYGKRTDLRPTRFITEMRMPELDQNLNLIDAPEGAPTL